MPSINVPQYVAQSSHKLLSPLTLLRYVVGRDSFVPGDQCLHCRIILLCAGRDSIKKSFADILGLILLSNRD